METMAINDMNNLYKAAESGDVALLEQLYQNKVDVFAQFSPGGNTALHISAYHGHGNFVERLLELIDETLDEEARNEERKHRLLRAQSKEENSALHEAVRGGDHDQIVKKLIEADKTLSGICNKKGESPLFTASAYGRFNALKILLPQTDPLRYVRFDGQTCLHQALCYRQYEVAAELIIKAPQLCKLADYFLGKTPLHIAAFHGCPENIVQMLLQCDPFSCLKQNKIKKQTALHIAAGHGHAHVVRCLLESAKCCGEIRDEVGRTALHYAVENAQVLVVRYLVLDMGIVINAVDNNGNTALDIAVQQHEKEPLSPYLGIRLILRSKNAIAGEAAANKRRKARKPFLSEERYSTAINCLSVCAILIATLTFQAAFTLPHETRDIDYGKNELFGLVDHRGKKGILALLNDTHYFRDFIIYDTLAFYLSLVAVFLLAYANFLHRQRGWAVAASAFIITLALFMIISLFSSAILVQLKHKYPILVRFPDYGTVIVGITIYGFALLPALNALGVQCRLFRRL